MPTTPALRPLPLDFRALRIIASAGTSALVMAPPQAVIVKFAPRLSSVMPRLFHGIFCGVTGVEVETRGRRIDKGPVLYVANHVSWLDIPVLGSRIPASFVAKSEVDAMGVFGKLSRLQRTIYVERDARHRTGHQRDEIIERLARGDNIILFPEGTSSNGNGVLPFKSSLFSVAEKAAHTLSPMTGAPIDLRIQPVTLAYTHLNAMPLSRAQRYKVAWVGDDELVPHFRQVMQLGRIRAHIEYHEPVKLSDFGSRKALAQHCHKVVSRGLKLANAGRLSERP